ncbi:MAG: hypothetical protein OWR62_03290 [Sulfobacillus thermotolerans]|uniref:Uncharacterized protein n=1 Tax=Sulfobacillus thermotolerans TaxID=338644 RepID=A0ABM6RTG4_9FIRM|nr:hypothetical protein BXT84_12410 [Sulfobacillus thermotolerans]MCY0907395.1 hypothetical protein [Sulfobacillus thermotolerans]
MLTSYRGDFYKIIRVLERRLLQLASRNFFSHLVTIKQRVLWRWYQRIVAGRMAVPSVELA